MRNNRKILVGLVAAAALAASAALVYADPIGPGGGCQYGGGRGAMGYGPGAGRGDMGPGMMGYGPGAGRGDMGPGAMGYGPGAGRGNMGPGMMGHGPGADRGGMGHSSGASRGQMGPGMWRNPAAAIEGHLAALKVELKITPDQDSAWQAFTAKARQQGETTLARRAQMSAQMSGTALSAPERLAQRTELAKQGVAGMESMSAAVKDLYAALTPEQKTIADQLLARGPMGRFAGRGFAR